MLCMRIQVLGMMTVARVYLRFAFRALVYIKNKCCFKINFCCYTHSAMTSRSLNHAQLQNWNFECVCINKSSSVINFLTLCHAHLAICRHE